MKDALIRGLNIVEEDIIICGDKGTVELSEFIQAIQTSLFTKF